MVSMNPRCWWLTRGVLPAQTSQTSCFIWFKGFSSTAWLRLNSWCLPWSLVLPHYILSQGMVPPSTTQNWEPRTYPQYFPLNSHIQTTTSRSFYPLELSNLPTSFHVYYILPSLSSVIFHLDYCTSLLTDLTGYTLDHFKQMIHIMQPVRSLWNGKSDYVALLLQWLPTALETASNALPVTSQTLHVLTPFYLPWSSDVLVPPSLSLCTPAHWPLAS